MQIFVRTPMAKTITLEVEADETVQVFKQRVCEKEGYCLQDVRLSRLGAPLQDELSLADCNLHEGSHVEVLPRLLGGHCQVPCGIFDDPKLVADLKEACATIGKACAQIAELSSTTLTALSLNQTVRWVNTKEEHAGKIIKAIAEYCLCQRVKPVSDPKSPFKSDKDYVEALTAHHAAMAAAVKCKQTTDLANVAKLEELIAQMCKMYQAAGPSNADAVPAALGSDPPSPEVSSPTGTCSACEIQ
mmetsp:Transcript_72846/g.152105  ORF Transcript_72846/g.152105 Transcript_72846/m.152105 type:complete len:245 (-) Transcript_72846:59-793(-)